MHEMPIVLNVVNFVDKFAEENGHSEIKAVVMQIGDLASVMPGFFKKCWSSACERSERVKTAKLEIELVPGIAKCTGCGTEFKIKAHDGICPDCKGRYWDIISGRDISIKEVRV